MSATTPSYVDVKIILEIDGTGQRDEVYITVQQTESMFDCLVAKFGGSEYWTKLQYRENGVHVTGWRVIGQSGIMYPASGFKSRLDEHLQKLFTKQNRPKCEIYLRHTNQRRAFIRIQWYSGRVMLSTGYTCIFYTCVY